MVPLTSGELLADTTLEASYISGKSRSITSESGSAPGRKRKTWQLTNSECQHHLASNELTSGRGV